MRILNWRLKNWEQLSFFISLEYLILVKREKIIQGKIRIGNDLYVDYKLKFFEKDLNLNLNLLENYDAFYPAALTCYRSIFWYSYEELCLRCTQNFQITQRLDIKDTQISAEKEQTVKSVKQVHSLIKIHSSIMHLLVNVYRTCKNSRSPITIANFHITWSS